VVVKGSLRTARRRCAIPTLIALTLILAACTAAPLGSAGTGAAGSGGQNHTPTTTTAPPVPVTELPGDGTKDVLLTAPISLSVNAGALHDVALISPSGTKVSGALSAAGNSWATTEVLGYDSTYTWSGTATGPGGSSSPVTGAFSTLKPERITSATVNIGDNDTVGIAAPIILQFSGKVTDKATVQKALTVSTTPPTMGSWAWLPDSPQGARVHWRPKDYYAPGTVVDVSAKLYGVDLGGGAYGRTDLTSHFTIGRSQIVKADASSHRSVVIRNGQTLFDFPVSYGKADLPRNITRSGIHVVSEKLADVYMSNPAAGYSNVHEKWAVRISDNGEFIHANPDTVDVQGSTNVSNGCINESTADAQKYFNSAMFGDPVEVTNTSIKLSPADGDIYDWAVPWSQWQSMSAL
jgi:lipoprotein-anchoring transpeptidase ErfK/SrfK